MINFDALPNERPAKALLEKGHYLFSISKAEMKQPKDPAKKQYLNVTMELTDKDGKQAGKFWDMQFDSDSSFLQFKLKRFLDAIGVALAGEFALKDLTKIIVNKSGIVYISVDEKQEQPRNQVEPFEGDMYYPLAEWTAVTGLPYPLAPKATANKVPVVAAVDSADTTTPLDVPAADEY